MKKGTIITTCIALAGMAVVGGIWWFNHGKDKSGEENQQAATATEAEIDFAELLSSKGIKQAIRMPNSEEVVYIEGISKEEADSLDNALRMYEETLGAEVDTTDSLAYIYTEMGPAIESWFDPAVDTVAAFKATEHDPTGVNAWLTNPLEEALAREEYKNAFYFKERSDGGYNMSYGYYLIGYTHSSLWQLLQQAEQ